MEDLIKKYNNKLDATLKKLQNLPLGNDEEHGKLAATIDCYREFIKELKGLN